MAAPSWLVLPRNYKLEKKRKAIHGEVLERDKGQKNVKETKDSSSADPLSQSDVADPLNAGFVDPLTQMASALAVSPSKSSSNTLDSASDETFEPWSSKKQNILTKYTTSEKLTIVTSFLSSADASAQRTFKAQSSVTDTVKSRLEQLDDFEEGSVQEMLNLSQQEYVKRIEELNSALIDAWEHEQRVKSLKIAIQCAKLLADTSVIQFYPSKFVLVTEILDTFGRLVFDRIFSKATYVPRSGGRPVQLPKNFTPDQVPDSAKETCRNWFFKIASIRELIPRFFVETAILKCYDFLAVGEGKAALFRLTNMVRGIGDPLIAVYARCYLCRVGVFVSPGNNEHVVMCFNDFITSYPQVQGDSVQNTLARQKLELPRYLTLYSPGLDWILQCVAHRSSEETMVNIMAKCKEQRNNALLINSIMAAFKPQYVADRALQFHEIIRDCEESGFPKHLLYRSLGVSLVLAETPDRSRLTILNEVWKFVMKLKLPADYIQCAEVWIEFVAKNFTKKELNTILGDVIRHMTPDRAFEDHYAQLLAMLSKMLDHMRDFSALFGMDKFLPFLDLFQKESVRVDASCLVMKAFEENHTEPGADPIIINSAMTICKLLHDSVNALTIEDEVRSISHLIISFLRLVSFERDFEQQLSFYVEARASFNNLDAVLVYLVQAVNTLSMNTREIMKGNHSNRTAAFVRACAAYCFITIPSLEGEFSRLNLYLLSGQVALANLCLSQADAFFKAAISLICEIPKTVIIDGKSKTTDFLLLDYLCNFLSALVIVPDSPAQGVLYLVRGLLNALNAYQWTGQTSDTKFTVYLFVLQCLSTMRQEVYPYKIEKVDSNDSLYGNDAKFLDEINAIATMIVDEILGHLKTLEQQDLKLHNHVKRKSECKDHVFFYNFGWEDYGVGSLDNLLDMVRVMQFTLTQGKVAVHCHAGLGRTGVLIAGYLVFTNRLTPSEAINYVRSRRPGSIQTLSQITFIEHFANHLQPLRIIYSISSKVNDFTLQQFLKRQGKVLHGMESRELKHLPKIIKKCLDRLLDLACVTAVSVPSMRRQPSLDLLKQSHPGAFAASRKSKLNVAPSNHRQEDDLSDSADSLHSSTDLVREFSTYLRASAADLSTEHPLEAARETLRVAEALAAPVRESASRATQRAEQLKALVNDDSDAWVELDEEEDPEVLAQLLWDWLDHLKEPVVSAQDIPIMLNEDDPQVALSRLGKGSRCVCEYVLRGMAHLLPVSQRLECDLIQRAFSVLTHTNMSTEDEILNAMTDRRTRNGADMAKPVASQILAFALQLWEVYFNHIETDQNGGERSRSQHQAQKSHSRNDDLQSDFDNQTNQNGGERSMSRSQNQLRSRSRNENLEADYEAGSSYHRDQASRHRRRHIEDDDRYRESDDS